MDINSRSLIASARRSVSPPMACAQAIRVSASAAELNLVDHADPLLQYWLLGLRKARRSLAWQRAEVSARLRLPSRQRR